MDKLISKINASTLVEVIVAMVIISSVFILSLAVFLNIGKNSNNSLKIKAALVSEDVMVYTRQNNLFVNENISMDNLDIIKEVRQYKSYKDMVLVTVEVKDKRGKSLVVKKELMIEK